MWTSQNKMSTIICIPTQMLQQCDDIHFKILKHRHLLWLKLMNTDWGVILIARDTKFKGVWGLLYRESVYPIQYREGPFWGRAHRHLEWIWPHRGHLLQTNKPTAQSKNTSLPYPAPARPWRVPEGTRLLDFLITTRTLLENLYYSLE